MISKDQLVFDTTDADSIAASDSVGAFVRSSDGTLITHTTVGGKEALDVRVAEGINVEVDLDAADDSVAAWLSDGAGNALSSTAGALHVSDGGDSITVDATDFDIRDLTAASDSVQSNMFDGAGTALTSTLVGSDQALDVNVVAQQDAALANSAIATAANTLAAADTAQDVVASPLASRKYLYIKNMDNKQIYIGPSGVSTADGFPMSPSAIAELRIGSAVDIEFVGVSGATPAIRTMELS